MPPGSLWLRARPLMAGRAVSALAGIALPMLVARLLTPADYGTYKQLFLVSALAAYSLQFGLAQSLLYFVPRSRDEAERAGHIGQTHAMLLVIGVATGLGLFTFAPRLARSFSNPGLEKVALPLAVMAGALVASAALETTQTACGRLKRGGGLLMGSELLRIVLLVAAGLLGFGVGGIAWAGAAAALARCLTALALIGDLGKVGFSRERAVEQLRYALPFGASVLVLQQQQQLHQLFVAAHETPARFALYAVGSMQVPVVGLLYAPLSETLQVRLAALERDGRSAEAGEAFAEVVERLASLLLPLAALMAATARPALVLLYGPAYAGAANVLALSAASVAAASLPLDGVFKARGRTGWLLFVAGLKLAATWPSVALGWRLGGLAGAMAGQVAVELTARAGQLAMLSRDLRSPVVRLLGGGDALRAALTALGIGMGAATAVRLI
ncbi:MAG: hypothetical protein RL199_992, partial [Pseudomonadota bacterium]